MRTIWVASVCLALGCALPALAQDSEYPPQIEASAAYINGSATPVSLATLSNTLLKEMDSVLLQLDVRIAPADEEEQDQDIELFYEKISTWVPYSVYMAPEGPPMGDDTAQDEFLPLVITRIGANLYRAYIGPFFIPEFNGVNQARLRGYIDYDVRWAVSVRVWDQDTVDEEVAPPSVGFLIYAVEDPALRPNNNPPAFPDAGADQTIAAGSTADLDGSLTFDGYNLGFDPLDPNVFEKDTIQYVWEQLTGPDDVAPTYPDLVSRPWLAQVTLNVTGTYEYRLAVSDGVNPMPNFDTVTVNVVAQLPVNLPPHGLIVGPGQAVVVGDVVTLDATGSTDPNGDTLQYHWRQVDEVGGDLPASEFGDMFQPLGGTQTATASWQAQSVGTYYFLLVVSDGELSDTAGFSVEVVESETAQAGAQTVVSGETSNEDTNSLTATTAGCGAGLLPLAALPLLLWFMRGRIR